MAVPSTLIHYKDSDKIERSKKVKHRFNAQTSILDIVDFILSWLWGDFAFDLQIKDPDLALLVDLDDHYFDEHKPFVNQTITTSTVELTILETRGKFYCVHPLFSSIPYF